MNSTVGCFGKLNFADIDAIQRKCGVPEAYWADAISVSVSNEVLCSIDTVALDLDRVCPSVGVGIFHGINDIYAAGGLPRGFSLSLTLPDNFAVNDMFEIGSIINACARAAKCTVGKLHTNRADAIAILTVSSIGARVNSTTLLPKAGIVYLLDSLSDAKSTISAFDLANLASRVALREFVVSNFPVAMKDVSGDGLAGSLYQLSVRHSLAISINPKVVSALVKSAPLDSCSQDKNYNDYGDSIEGFAKYNTSLVRQALFEPQLFGPLVCLSQEEVDLTLIGAVEIGSFAAGERMLGFRSA